MSFKYIQEDWGRLTFGYGARECVVSRVPKKNETTYWAIVIVFLPLQLTSDVSKQTEYKRIDNEIQLMVSTFIAVFRTCVLTCPYMNI